MTGAARPPGPQQWLDPAVLARLGSLELKARVIVEGFLQGLHRSPFKGFSVEFAEYRPYLPGDDPASIDWRAFARTDRYYVKRFEQETNLPCHLLLDVSASMGYGSGPLTKLQYGSYLAASLAYLLSRQRDAVGLMAFDHDVVTHLPPSTRPRHLRSLLVALDALRPGTRSDLARPLNRLAAARAPRPRRRDFRSPRRPRPRRRRAAPRPVPRDGGDRLPGARPRGADVPLRRRHAVS
jgi:uncharacterized protein (DUF58 family)